MNKKIVIAGATGLVGKTLYETLKKQEYQIVIVSREIEAAKRSLPHAQSYVLWTDNEGLVTAINGSFGVINLAGSPLVGKRWTKAYKNILYESRITTTKTIVDIIEKVKEKPKLLINGSAVGYYGTAQNNKVYDESSPPGSDFLAKLCESWEKGALQAEKSGCRVVCIRTAVVLDKNEGALPRMLTPFYFFAGGPIGSGKQGFSWIHIKDEVGILCFALENEKVRGIINAVSPDAVTNKVFAMTIGKILHRPSFIPVPAFVLRLLFGEAADVLTTGVTVSSQKITQLGYRFTYEKLESALRDILIE